MNLISEVMVPFDLRIFWNICERRRTLRMSCSSTSTGGISTKSVWAPRFWTQFIICSRKISCALDTNTKMRRERSQRMWADSPRATFQRNFYENLWGARDIISLALTVWNQTGASSHLEMRSQNSLKHYVAGSQKTGGSPVCIVPFQTKQEGPPVFVQTRGCKRETLLFSAILPRCKFELALTSAIRYFASAS